jgi:putative MATE family efflux protein
MRRLIDTEVTQVRTAEGRVITLRQLFVPYFIEQLLMNLMGTVNTLVLGHYSDDAVAAVGAAGQVMGLIYTFYAVVSGGASIIISHRLGEGSQKRASDAAFAAIVMGGVLSLAVSLCLFPFSGLLMQKLNLEGDVLQMATQYFRICILTSVLQGVMSAVSAVLRSYGKPVPAVACSIFMNAVNAVLNCIVVFRPFETPFHGASGIAVSGVISRSMALVLICICLVKSRLNLDLVHKRFRDLSCVRGILRVGMPGGISNLSYSLSQVVSTSILAILGTTALSAKIYISTIVFYVYVIGMSLGLSTAILIGWMTGAGEYEKAYRLNQQVLKIAITLNITLSLCMFLAYRPLMGLFTSNTEIIQMARGIFLIDIFVEIGRGFNHVEDNSLRGAGDVVFPMTVAIISCWCMSILFSYILGIRCGMGLYGCWIAFMMDEMFRGMLLWRRFRSRKWMRKRI